MPKKIKFEHNGNYSALHIAFYREKFESLKDLIDLGTDINQIDERGQTVLHLAVVRGDLDLVKYLLEKGANVNQADDSGQTALHFAMGANPSDFFLDVIKYLVKKGADFIKTDKEGISPLVLVSPHLLPNSTTKWALLVSSPLAKAWALISSILLRNPAIIIPDFISRDKAASAHWSAALKGIDDMKKEKFPGGSYSFYDFLNEDSDELTKSMSKENIEACKKLDLFKRFPSYCGSLRQRLEKLEGKLEKRRKLLLNLSNKVSISANNVQITLNSDCLHKINSFLTNSDIKNLLRSSLFPAVEFAAVATCNATDQVMGSSERRVAP